MDVPRNVADVCCSLTWDYNNDLCVALGVLTAKYLLSKIGKHYAKES
jgi:hypothetical protein